MTRAAPMIGPSRVQSDKLSGMWYVVCLLHIGPTCYMLHTLASSINTHTVSNNRVTANPIKSINQSINQLMD